MSHKEITAMYVVHNEGMLAKPALNELETTTVHKFLFNRD